MEKNLMTQPEARQEAHRLNDAEDFPKGMRNVAQTVPAGAWGGEEDGWTVALVAVGPLSRAEAAKGF